MEKWKVVLISVMLVGLFGYGWYSQNSGAAVAPVVVPTPAASNQIQVGQNLPAWEISDPKLWVNTPKPIELDDLKGSYALVEIFRTGCSHCQEAAPFMVSLYNRYSPRGLKMVTIQSPGAIDPTENPEENDWTKVQAWLKQYKIQYPVAFDKDSAYFQGTLKGSNYPTVMVLDKDGKILETHTGHDAAKGTNLAIVLENLLPGNGDKTARAKDLMTWLRGFTDFQNKNARTEMEAAVKGNVK